MISRRVRPSGAPGSSPGSMKVSRQRVDLSDTGSFGQAELKPLVDLTGKTWVRLEAWDIACNGAFTQPVWLKPADCGHGSRAGSSSGVVGVDARRATPPDPRPPRWGRAGCCQLDPSHQTLVTCAVGREGRHAPRPNDVGGQPRFPGAKKEG